jgi:hypothetical protein
MVQIHPQARTTPAVRAEIARLTEPASVVAKRYDISDETVRMAQTWRTSGPGSLKPAHTTGVAHERDTFDVLNLWHG